MQSKPWLKIIILFTIFVQSGSSGLIRWKPPKGIWANQEHSTESISTSLEPSIQKLCLITILGNFRRIRHRKLKKIQSFPYRGTSPAFHRACYYNPTTIHSKVLAREISCFLWEKCYRQNFKGHLYSPFGRLFKSTSSHKQAMRNRHPNSIGPQSLGYGLYKKMYAVQTQLGLTSS